MITTQVACDVRPARPVELRIDNTDDLPLPYGDRFAVPGLLGVGEEEFVRAAEPFRAGR